MNRRDVIAGSMALATTGASLLPRQAHATAPPMTGSRPSEDLAIMTKQIRIAVEETFALPEIAEAAARYLKLHPEEEVGIVEMQKVTNPAYFKKVMPPLFDLGQSRIDHMDHYGIDLQLLSLMTPGVQMFGTEEAVELAAFANNRLSEAVKAHPTRYAALAAVAPQDPAKAALELQRCVNNLGFKGLMINSHTKGRYLDEQFFWPILEAAEALDVPLYIHPRPPSNAMVGPYLAQQLEGSSWGFAAETGLHALRMMFGGVFQAFPKLKIVLGHMGEGIPLFLDRLDRRYIDERRGMPTDKIKQMPSECFLENFVVTTSGFNWGPSLMLAMQTLGPDRILFAIDYPFEDSDINIRPVEEAPISAIDRDKIFRANAQRVFKLQV